jgi:hypothetical protein
MLRIVQLLIFLVIVVCSAFSTRANPSVPDEYKKYIIDRASNRETFLNKMCALFDLCASMKFDRSVAMVIGVSKYHHLPELKSTANDAHRFADFLLDSTEFDEVVLLEEDNATNNVITYFMEDYFPKLIDSTGGRARFLFYFSGHGDSVSNSNGSSRGYLRLIDDKPGEFAHSIRMDVVAQWAQENTASAKHSLYIIDSCVSGLALSSEHKEGEPLGIGRNPADLARYSEGSIITAGAESDSALADPKWNGSLFTATILEALTQTDTIKGSGDGIISEYEMFDFVQRRVANESGGAQTPRRREFRKEKEGDFFFVSPNVKPVKIDKDAPPLSSQSKGAGAVVFSGSDAAAIWGEIRETKNPDVLHAFVEQYPNTLFSAEAQSKEDELRDANSAGLPDAEKWRFWKVRGIWENADTYCNDLSSFLSNVTHASNLKYTNSENVNVDHLSAGILDRNYFVRNSTDGNKRYCNVYIKRKDYFSVSCGRRITKSPLVYNAVLHRTLNDLRTCLKPKGWVEETANGDGCNAEALDTNLNCDHEFTRGPQSLWLFATKGNDGYGIGFQTEIEVKSGKRFIQGDYSFVDDGILVRSVKNGKEIKTKYAKNGDVIEIEYPKISTKYQYYYNDSRNVVAVFKLTNGTIKEKINLEYDLEGRITKIKSDEKGTLSLKYSSTGKPSEIDLDRLGNIFVEYDQKGDIMKISHGATAEKIATIFNDLLDVIVLDGDE